MHQRSPFPPELAIIGADCSTPTNAPTPERMAEHHLRGDPITWGSNSAHFVRPAATSTLLEPLPLVAREVQSSCTANPRQ